MWKFVIMHRLPWVECYSTWAAVLLGANCSNIVDEQAEISRSQAELWPISRFIWFTIFIWPKRTKNNSRRKNHKMPVRRGHVAPRTTLIETIIRKFDTDSEYNFPISYPQLFAQDLKGFKVILEWWAVRFFALFERQKPIATFGNAVESPALYVVECICMFLHVFISVFFVG